MAAVALELVAAELVHRLLPFSLVLGQVTLDLASGMMETHLSPPSSQNRVTYMLNHIRSWLYVDG